MMKDKKIGFIGGGNMAEAILSGMIKKKIVPPESITVADKMKDKLEILRRKYNVLITTENSALINNDIIILAVKPQNFKDIAPDIKDIPEKNLVISILAGVRIEKIQKTLGNHVKVIRVMPNTPALAGEGMSAISAADNCSRDDIKSAEYIFKQMGLSEIFEEKDIDLVTAVSGSGPAYVFYFIESMIEAAVKLGMNRDHASVLVTQTFKGAVALLELTAGNPSELRKKVTSKGGTTERAISVMDENNLKQIIYDAVKAAMLRSEKLSDNV
ncbi:pyrroline-5-carboxylate reductase [bacterium]|nr:pyrroline-5-carboxylate reductase [bacterium]